MIDRPVAVVTGASRGLGAAIVRRLADDGWAVGCVATTTTSAQAIVDEVTDGGGAALALGALVQDRDQLAAALAAAEAALGPISLMVNNAGIAHVTPFEELDPDDFRTMVDVNLMGVFHGSQLAAQHMIASATPGSIVQIGSIAGINGFPQRVGYCGTKAAVHQMTKVMAIDLASRGIRVNAVAPGYIRTDMVQDLIDAGTLDASALTNRIPSRSLGTPEDIAACVSWLASPEARYITGETIAVDGGWTAYGHV